MAMQSGAKKIEIALLEYCTEVRTEPALATRLAITAMSLLLLTGTMAFVAAFMVDLSSPEKHNAMPRGKFQGQSKSVHTVS